MSALALDEFSLEMRLHYIQTTLAELARFKSESQFSSELKESLDGWIAEAKSNDMNFFVSRLEKFKEEQKVEFDRTALYLEELKTQADSAEILEKYSVGSSSTSSELYLYCLYGQNHFLVPVQNIVEIVSNKSVSALPFSQKGLVGMTSFRGEGIPVMDLKFHGFQSHGEDLDTVFVVCQHEGATFAVEVHKTEEVYEFSQRDFQKAQGGLWSTAVDKFTIKDQKTLMLLEIEKLVNS